MRPLSYLRVSLGGKNHLIYALFIFFLVKSVVQKLSSRTILTNFTLNDNNIFLLLILKFNPLI